MSLADVSAIALSELKIVVRNKTVLIGATLVPLTLGAYLIWTSDEVSGGWLAILVMQVIFLSLFSIYLTVTTTMATRRQELFLKRLRSGETSDLNIIAGLVAPIVLLLGAQLAIVLAAMFIAGAPAPQHPGALAAAIVAVSCYCTTTGVLTSIFTPSAAAAQVTSLPFFGFVAGTSVWALFATDWFLVLTPGGAATILIQAAYEPMSALADYAPAAGSLLAWILIPALLARRSFRWEPRH